MKFASFCEDQGRYHTTIYSTIKCGLKSVSLIVTKQSIGKYLLLENIYIMVDKSFSFSFAFFLSLKLNNRNFSFEILNIDREHVSGRAKKQDC